MYEPVKFKRLNELASELNTKLNALQQGKLNAEELNGMTEQSRELYERLLVLRHKAFDQMVNPAQADTVEITAEKAISKTEEAQPSFAFKIEETKPEPGNQVSLIDAIEEVIKEENEIVDQMASPTLPEESTAAAAPVRHTYAAQPSLYDKLSQGMNSKESLADKLEHNPIADLKKAITLNQRFQFSKELFKGNNQDYEVAIDKLNTAGREEAMTHLSNLQNKYSWPSGNSVASDFISLVERRHQL
ncbi:MAG: hypothetical protein ACKVOR_04460 [Flavobacteriales bacterium]